MVFSIFCACLAYSLSHIGLIFSVSDREKFFVANTEVQLADQKDFD